MKKLMLTGLAFASLGMSSFTLAQAEVEVEWMSPEKYRDVKPTSQSRKKFQDATFTHIDAYLLKLAEDLPQGSKLLIKVSDLDLAGQVMPAGFAGIGIGHSGSDVRVVKQIYIPRINFSYQLLDTSGGVLREAEVKLKDMSFFDRSNRFFKSEPLRYEKLMLKKWFKQEFEAYLVSLAEDDAQQA